MTTTRTAPPAEGPVTCGACNSTAHLRRSPSTGNLLTLDVADDLDSVHPCVLASMVVLIDIDQAGGQATAIPVKGSPAVLSHILAGRLEGPAEWAAGAERRLSHRDVVVLRRGQPPADLYGGAV